MSIEISKITITLKEGRAFKNLTIEEIRELKGEIDKLLEQVKAIPIK